MSVRVLSQAEFSRIRDTVLDRTYSYQRSEARDALTESDRARGEGRMLTASLHALRARAAVCDGTQWTDTEFGELIAPHTPSTWHGAYSTAARTEASS